MVRKIFFGIATFMLSILFTNFVSAADIDIDYDAELSKTCKPSHCLVPIPTLVDPNEKIIKIDENFYLTGLTWNNTKIDIYLDDQYQGSATVVEDDDSDTANFYYLIGNNSLFEGQHRWKVIAWTENLRKRSYVSVESKFVIENHFPAPQLNKITTDIDGNNWLVGSAEANSLVSIYVDHVYRGQVRTDGNFNYKIGNLSPGLHTFYALAQEMNTSKISKRSNVLSEQVAESQIIAEEPVQSEEDIEDLADLEIIEEVEVLEESISSISEERSSNDDLFIQSEENNTNVDVIEAENFDVEVGVINEEESQDQLVVENQKSEGLEKEEDIFEDEEKSTASEDLQPASPSLEEEEMIREELNIVEKQERNRKVGLFLLVILIVIVLASTFISKKKNKSFSEDKKKDEHNDSHQGKLFDGE